jgi:hypothetical protein
MVTLMSSTMAHQSAFGQSSTTSAGPATTPPLGQNTMSSSPVDEGVIINSLLFELDGTGLLRLNSNRTVGPFIPFTHNLTEANGYTIYSSVPFFANNGTIVDLNSIDFSSQIVIDPSANVTLPARPMLSPSATPDISSLPPPSSQIVAPPSTQPAPTAPTNPTEDINTQMNRLAASDPAFAQFNDVRGECFGLSGPYDLSDLPPAECNPVFEEAYERYCLPSSSQDAEKCGIVKTVIDEYKAYIDCFYWDRCDNATTGGVTP